ncbi:MAG: DNA polymerase I [Rikenellaceae bacterium]|nr:DNA polymerase I [Rikenellaceae bacterium]
MPKLFLVDAYALIFRSYYAFINRPMRNSAGLNTSPIFGFTKFIRDVIVREKPDYLGVAFDPHGGNFRHQLYPEYKANRSATPEDIVAAVPYIKQILDAMCIPVLEVAGYEADDVIGTLSCRASEAGFDVFMVTPDKDYGQLVKDRVVMYKPAKGDDGVEIVDRAAIREHYGFDDPRLVADILALWGDASDNVPGVQGVGEKGAIKLVNTYGDVEQILANIDKLTPRQKTAFEQGREQLRLSKRLVTIDTNVPIEFLPEELRMCAPDSERLRALFTELNFSRFQHEMEGRTPTPFRASDCAECSKAKSAPQPAAPSLQGSLFADEVPSATAGEMQGDLFAAPEMRCAATVEHTYTVIDDTASLEALVEKLATQPRFAFDTETSGFDWWSDRIVGVSIAIEPHKAYYIPLSPDNTTERLNALRPVFENEAIVKIGQNIKFDMLWLRRYGVSVAGFKLDTMILHYLLDAESRHSMNYMARTLLDYDPIEISTLIGTGARQLTMDRVAVPVIAEYAAEDADITLQLCDVLWPRVQTEGFEKLYRTIEEPMIDVLADMEWEGVRIDTEALGRYAVTLGEQLAGIEAQIREMADCPELNINSSRQLGEVLFERLKVDSKPRKTKTKQYATDEEYLQMLSSRHPIIPLILEYRGIKKLLSTYVEALPLLVNAKTGRIHTSYNQAVTATGRLSSTNPNLQNIPIRDEMGKPIRAAFVAADAEHILLSADYSQVELRLMAHLSGDEALLEAFRRGEDIHAATAARIFGKEIADVTSDERRRAKTANFGIIYGISAFGLAQRLGISRSEAKELIDGYFRSYPAVHDYMERVVAEARESGAVTTLFGRRRVLADINSRNAVARGLAERNAINTPLQGSAADIMKLAMIEVRRRFRAEGVQSRMILQVHDEIVVDCLRSEVEKVRRIVTESMEGAAQLRIVLEAEAGVGENWLAAH